MKKILCCLLVLLMLFSVAACAQRNDPGGDDNKPPVVDPGGDSEGFIPRKKQEMPVAKIVDTDNDYGADSGWAGDAYASLDLGSVYLQDFINDTVYDWGHSVIYEDGTYKMWWVRPAIYDSIYYAESKDLKNWTNVQRVICLSPNSTNVKKYDNIKGMIGKPSVLHVDGTYYMYFEAPASEDPDITQTVLEWDNQVLLATSSDGIEWEFYCDENGEPIPVIAMPEELMGNTNDKEYGAGQPSAFYKDGKFYVTYCYVIYSQNIAEIRVASSEDGKTFGDVSTHRKISGGNGYGVTYNTKTEKYMMATPEKIYESDTLDFNSAKSYTYYTYDTSSVQTGFCEFVKNPSGLVDTETFYTIHLQGAKSTTGDWRGEHKTWDGHIHAVNPCEYENRPLTLPNGGKATEKIYRNIGTERRCIPDRRRMRSMRRTTRSRSTERRMRRIQARQRSRSRVPSTNGAARLRTVGRKYTWLGTKNFCTYTVRYTTKPSTTVTRFRVCWIRICGTASTCS